MPSKAVWITAISGCLITGIGVAILFPVVGLAGLLVFVKAVEPRPPAPIIVSLPKNCTVPLGVQLAYRERAKFRIDRMNLDVAYLGDDSPVSLTGRKGVLPKLTPSAAPIAVTTGFWRLRDTPQRAAKDGDTGRFLRIDDAPEDGAHTGLESIVSPDGRFAAVSESRTVAQRESRYVVSVRRIGNGEEIERIELRNAMPEQVGWLSDRHLIVTSAIREQPLLLCNLEPEASAPPIFQFTDQPAEFLGIDTRPRTLIVSQPGAATVSGEVRWDGGGIVETAFDAEDRQPAKTRRFRVPTLLNRGSLIPWLRIDGREVSGIGFPIRTSGVQAAVATATGSRITFPDDSLGSRPSQRFIVGEAETDSDPVCRGIDGKILGPCVLRTYENGYSEGYTELDYLGAEQRQIKVFGPSTNGQWRRVASWNLSLDKPPSAVAITPYMAVGRNFSFTALASDGDGAADIARVEVKIAFAIDGRGACIFALDSRGGASESAACKVQSEDAGRESTLFSQKARVRMGPSMRGRQNVFVRAIDREGAASEWRWMASWKME